jgi:hypothetical protein
MDSPDDLEQTQLYRSHFAGLTRNAIGTHPGSASASRLQQICDTGRGGKAPMSHSATVIAELTLRRMNHAPIVGTQNKYSDFLVGQILLIAEFVIRCDEQVEPGPFSPSQQCPVLQAGPSLEPSCNHCVPVISSAGAVSGVCSRPG